MQSEPVFIYDAIRTPRARAKETGGLHDLLPFDLLAALYGALEERTGLDPARIGEVVLGCVTQHGEQAANIAKTSTLYAGWPSSISGITVNRFCSSGLDAVNFAAIATLYGVSREQADAVALASQQRAAAARESGRFKSIVGVQNPHTGMLVEQDECIRPGITMESLASLEPSFAKLGSMGVDAFQMATYSELDEVQHIHTAGNSPAMKRRAKPCPQNPAPESWR